ncbi:cytochrome b-c1 complex subunit 7-like [Octopus vulgaris]|uniref:Cytochrome b-c1 complex subunit 7-like n=3 Tax=Octopus TaxID=6643 RepID=A0AA36FMJ5_OCTVU|nr:cytochrome b-c1 complex subunit 7 isoform X2 [Octopus sinensis]CAI9739298.1 cytochrome b-c1 complex subunit 7-like [Octopus vulgaris]
MAARQAIKEAPAWYRVLQQWFYNRSYFNQLGLMRDDVRRESEDVKEAIRRLPKDIYDARNFRLIRALNLSNKKIVLPKEEWTQLQDDVQYLKPYIEEVIKERKERQLWNSK